MRRQSSFIGLDIQPEEVRLLKLNRTKKNIIIEEAVALPLVPDTIVEGKVLQPDDVYIVLQELVQLTNSKSNVAAIALPISSVISKHIQMASYFNEIEREAEIITQLPRYFPGVTDPLCFDYVRLGMPYRDEEDRWFLVAARQTQLKSYVNLVEEAGLIVKAVDIDLYAISRAVGFCLSKKPLMIGIIDFCSLRPHFFVLYKKTIIFYQRFNQGDGSDIFLQFKNALLLCCSSHRQIKLSEIFFAGQFYHSHELKKMIQKELSLQVNEINPLNEFIFSACINPATFHTYATKYLIACGLALRGNNDVRN